MIRVDKYKRTVACMLRASSLLPQCQWKQRWKDIMEICSTAPAEPETQNLVAELLLVCCHKRSYFNTGAG